LLLHHTSAIGSRVASSFDVATMKYSDSQGLSAIEV
jgi:hypothetical protein